MVGTHEIFRRLLLVSEYYLKPSEYSHNFIDAIRIRPCMLYGEIKVRIL